MYAPARPNDPGERWLLEMGMPPQEAAAARARALSRARRYPRPVALLFPLLLRAFDWLGPLLLLGKLRRARFLSGPQWNQLLQRARHHRWPLVRLIMVMLLNPYMEQLLTEDAPPPVTHPLEGKVQAAGAPAELFDVVVIGSGAGGAPVATALTEAGAKVLIIEKGQLVKPGTTAEILEKHYVSQAMVGDFRGGLSLTLAGTAVGGTTPINSGTSLRPLRECMEAWDQKAGTAFAQDELTPYLDSVAHRIGITVPPRELFSASSRLVERGLQALGRDGVYVLPRNAPACVGSGRCCFGCPAQAKRSTDHAFLPKALQQGATLWSGTTATAIREYGEHVEVTVRGPEGEQRVRCKHLILSAGALFTPTLIRRHRLGAQPRALGRHFKMHPAAKVFAYFPDLQHGPGGVPQGLGYRPPELPRITMEGIHTPRGAAGPILSAAGDRFRWWLERYDQLASFGLMLRERTEGSVYEAAGMPQVSYRSCAEDGRDVAAGLRLIAEIFLAAGAERVLLPVSGDNEIASAADLERFTPDTLTVDRMTLSGFHPQGTAGMGRVVDKDLRLLGSRRISVCDASVMPDSPGVNPQVTIMALSLRLADHLAASTL